MKGTLFLFILLSPILLITTLIFATIYEPEIRKNVKRETITAYSKYFEYSIKLFTLVILVLPLLVSGAFIFQDPVSDPYKGRYPQVRFDFDQHSENNTITVRHMGGDTIDNEKDIIYYAVYVGDSEKGYRFEGSEITAKDTVVFPYDEGDVGKTVTVEIRYSPPDDNIVLQDYVIKNSTGLEQD